MLQGMAEALMAEPDRVDRARGGGLAACSCSTAPTTTRGRPRFRHEMARRLGARVRGRPGRGHSPAVENAAATAAALLAFWRASGPMTDLGYFGPDSVTWRIHGEPMSIVGGLRALLLQALHPGAMTKLYAAPNSRTTRGHGCSARPVRRHGLLRRASDVEAAAEHVRAVHRRLGITDVQQLAWVHACVVDSFLAAARAAGLRLGAPRPTATSRAGPRRRAGRRPAGRSPATTSRPARVLRRDPAAVGGHREAREAARSVIAPPLPVPRRFVLPARLGWTSVSSLAVGLLPPWARRMYGLPAAARRRPGHGAGMRALRGAPAAAGALPRGTAVPGREGPRRRRSAAAG